ncbi:uncharacterized protein ARMOST_11447 [Armillaria ostoyae]|uniref:Uncharacterized protein n=1 Tax=Armillaria ostoyae TaxID=47428 RepID=A0A284RH56_ARMOS|nr:uncharacterized protein ARMOST_11447 [Armillaria ostoyae]
MRDRRERGLRSQARRQDVCYAVSLCGRLEFEYDGIPVHSWSGIWCRVASRGANFVYGLGYSLVRLFGGMADPQQQASAFLLGKFN